MDILQEDREREYNRNVSITIKLLQRAASVSTVGSLVMTASVETHIVFFVSKLCAFKLRSAH